MKEQITREELQRHAAAGLSIEEVARLYGKTHRAVYQMCVKKQIALAGFSPRPRKNKPVLKTETKVPVAEEPGTEKAAVAVKTSTRIRAGASIMKEIVDCDLHIRRINRRRAQLLNELTDSLDQEPGRR